MKDEFSDRHQAIRMRLAGQSVEEICQTLERSREWFHLWWRRYQGLGTAGLYDLTSARHQPPHISPELERTIVNIRQRLASPLHAHRRYGLIGAGAIQAELQELHIRPLPCTHTIERVLERNGKTMPRVRLAPPLSEHVYPGPQAHNSNQLHEVDLVGPIYLKGQRQRYYIYVCKDVFDGAVYLKLGRSRPMEAILNFLGDAWKSLGRPDQIQLDNAREYPRLGTRRAVPGASNPALFAFRDRAGVYPTGPTPVQRQRGKFQRILPTTLAPTTFYPGHGAST